MEHLSREELLVLEINRLTRKVDELSKEVSAYEKHKNELEIELLKRDRKIELYLKVITKFRESADTGTKVDVSNEYRISTLEDKVTELEDGLKECTKILISTRNTLNEFLKRIYGK